MNAFIEFFARNDWATLGLVFAGPFIQEDAAVVGAATAAMSGHADPTQVFGAALLGLIASDTWKYWLGRAAQAHPWAAKYIADPRVAGAREKVLNRTGIALMVARFVPGTRIPLYIACGLFHVPFWRFLVLIVLSGALYLGIAFAAFASLGMVMGAQVRAALPFVALAAVTVVLLVGWIRSVSRKRAVDHSALL